MIVDTSVFVAILKDEPEAAEFSILFETAELLRTSAATYLESCIVIDGLRNPKLSVDLDEILARLR